MLSKEQSEVVADAMLSPSREAQQARKERAELQRRNGVSRQRSGWLGLAGFAIGAGLGHLLVGDAIPGAFVGLAAGFIVAQVLDRRSI